MIAWNTNSISAELKEKLANKTKDELLAHILELRIALEPFKGTCYLFAEKGLNKMVSESALFPEQRSELNPNDLEDKFEILDTSSVAKIPKYEQPVVVGGTITLRDVKLLLEATHRLHGEKAEESKE